MASIEKRGKNKFRIEVLDGRDPITGKWIKIRKTITAKNKTEAKKIANEFELEVRKGEYIQPANLTVVEHLKNWLKSQESELKITTLENYEVIVNAHFIPWFGRMKLQDVKPMHIERYKIEKLENGRRNGKGGLSNRSVRYHLIIMEKAFQWAVRLELIRKNPVENIEKPKKKKSKNSHLKTKQAAETIKAVFKLIMSEETNYANFMTYSAIGFDIFTGLRRGEVLGLRFGDIIFEKRFLMLEQNLQRTKRKGLQFLDLKTEGSQRGVYLSQTCLDILELVKKRQAKNKLLYGADYKRDLNLVFCNEDGSPISPYTFRHRYDRARKYLGIDVCFKDLRHTFATLVIDIGGANLREAGEMLGHTNMQTTGNIYYHPDINNQAEKINQVEKIVRGG